MYSTIYSKYGPLSLMFIVLLGLATLVLPWDMVQCEPPCPCPDLLGRLSIDNASVVSLVLPVLLKIDKTLIKRTDKNGDI